MTPEDHPKEAVPTSARWLALALLAAIASGNLLTPLLPEIRDEFGVSLTTAGFIVAAFGLARLIVDIPSALLADRFGLVGLSVSGVTMLIVSTLVGFLAPTVEIFIGSRVVAGIGVAIVSMVVLSAMSLTTGRASRGRAMSLIHVANNTGIAIYPLIGGAIGVLFGWRLTFVVAGVLAIAGAVVLVPTLARLVRRRDTEASTADREEDTPPLMTRRRLGLALFATYVGVVATFIHRHGFRNTFIPLYGATVLGLGAGPISVAIATMAVCGLIVAQPGGVLSDRLGRRRVIVSGLFAIALGDLLYLWTGDLVAFLLAAAIVGLGDFYSSSQAALLADLVEPRNRNRSLSGFRFSVDLGALVGPILLAVILDNQGAAGAIVATSAILAVAAIANLIAIPANVDHLGSPVAAAAPAPR